MCFIVVNLLVMVTVLIDRKNISFTNNINDYGEKKEKKRYNNVKICGWESKVPPLCEYQ